MQGSNVSDDEAQKVVEMEGGVGGESIENSGEILSCTSLSAADACRLGAAFCLNAWPDQTR
jgi:hypothetical protein